MLKIIFLLALHNDSIHLDLLSELFLPSYMVTSLLRNTFLQAKTRNMAPSRVLPNTWSKRSYIYVTVASFRDLISILDFDNIFSKWKTMSLRKKIQIDFLNRLYEILSLIYFFRFARETCNAVKFIVLKSNATMALTVISGGFPVIYVCIVRPSLRLLFCLIIFFNAARNICRNLPVHTVVSL